MLITYITAGDPSLAATEKLVYQLAAAGADIIELGIPFSDPLADGPVIQASHQRALNNGVSLAEVFRLVKKVKKKISTPICFMLSYNLVLCYGEDRFYADCGKAGVSGVIVPDLSNVQRPTSNVDTICLIAPTSSEERIKMITGRSSGFIYLVATTGVTGKRQALAGGLGELVDKIRKYSQLPIAVGFGISTPGQAAEAAKAADGVIVGSAIVDLIAHKKFTQVSQFVSTLRRAIDKHNV